MRTESTRNAPLPAHAPDEKSTFLIEKLEQAEHFFSVLPPFAIALSGGVDSSLVAVLAARFSKKSICITGLSASLSTTEQNEIADFCQKFQLRHIEVPTYELEQLDYQKNSPDRCFHCKNELYSVVRAIAQKEGCDIVVDGTHTGDFLGHRPGLDAAQKHQIRSPLAEMKWNKSTIRLLATHLGLPNHQRPAQPCLSSRLAYGIEVTPKRLMQIAKAEHALKKRGFPHCRVRHHESIARIEVPKSAFSRILEQADDLVIEFKEAGFTYVTFDLAGLRSGSLLEVISS